MSINLPPSEQEDIVVVGDGPVGKFHLVKSGTLGFSFSWSHHVGKTKERNQLLERQNLTKTRVLGVDKVEAT